IKERTTGSSLTPQLPVRQPIKLMMEEGLDEVRVDMTTSKPSVVDGDSRLTWRSAHHSLGMPIIVAIMRPVLSIGYDCRDSRSSPTCASCSLLIILSLRRNIA